MVDEISIFGFYAFSRHNERKKKFFEKKISYLLTLSVSVFDTRNSWRKRLRFFFQFFLGTIIDGRILRIFGRNFRPLSLIGRLLSVVVLLDINFRFSKKNHKNTLLVIKSNPTYWELVWKVEGGKSRYYWHYKNKSLNKKYLKIVFLFFLHFFYSKKISSYFFLENIYFH